MGRTRRLFLCQTSACGAGVCYDNPGFPRGMTAVTDTEAIRAHLEALRGEHRTLDDEIARLVAEPCDQLHVQRLKRQKFLLRDHIRHLESEMWPDIIA